ncbi:unnamed protein product [Phytophthora lilii]|uniref:Unnamed protein product n=1 Tax=Phytophthora lilii TaxID=2077276 RepID=A0A9W6T884_9STRA|nr:unnamed protein product [Phytophthora lilii]
MALGRHLVSSLSDVADDGPLSLCVQDLQLQLQVFEQETDGLKTLVSTGREVRVLVRAMNALLGVMGLLDDQPTREAWYGRLLLERDERMQKWEMEMTEEGWVAGYLSEDDAVQILTLLKSDVETCGELLTPREVDVMARVYDEVSQHFGVVTVTTPDWFVTTETEWPRAAKSVVDGGEEACVRNVYTWSQLHHPRIRNFYGACHVGEPFVVHENCSVLDKTTATWSNFLGCAHALRYLHEMNLAYADLSMYSEHLLFSESSKSGVVSGMGLVQQEPANEASDIRMFGLAILKLLERPRCPGDNGIIKNKFPHSKPSFFGNDEWKLVQYMSVSSTETSITMEGIVHRIQGLVHKPCTPKDPVASTTVADVGLYTIPSLGYTVNYAIQEASRLCNALPAFRDVNGPLYDRLRNLYDQMRSTLTPLPTRMVENFSMILIRFIDALTKREDHSIDVTQTSVVSIGASRTLAGKNYSIHRDIDRFLLESPSFSGSGKVHRWQPKWKVTYRQQRSVMDTLAEDPLLFLDQIDEELDQTEALTLLQFGATTIQNDTFDIKLGRHFLQQAQKISQGNNAVSDIFSRLHRHLSDHNCKSRLLQLAGTGSVAALILREQEAALQAANITDVNIKAEWTKRFEEERHDHIKGYEDLLVDEPLLIHELGDDRHQLEVLTKLKYGFEAHYHTLTPEELDSISGIYTLAVLHTGIVIGSIPHWFTTSGTHGQGMFPSSENLDGEEVCLRTMKNSTQLRHPSLRKIYGGCHVGIPFILVENCESVFAQGVSWPLLIGCAKGLSYIHEQGFGYEQLSLADLMKPKWEAKGVLSAVGLVHLNDTETCIASTSKDMFSFGLAIIEEIERFRSTVTSKAHQEYQADFLNSQPKFLTVAECQILQILCNSNGTEKNGMEAVIYKMELLAASEEKTDIPGDHKIVIDAGTYMVPIAGQTITKILAEIEGMCRDVESKCIHARFEDIYNQLESPPASFVNGFGQLLWSFLCYLDENESDEYDYLGSPENARSVEDSGNAFNFAIDRLILGTSSINADSSIHQWRSQMVNRRSNGFSLLMNKPGIEEKNHVDHSPSWLIPAYQVEIGEFIERGSFCTVYRGYWLGTDVAVKHHRPPPHYGTQETFKRQLDVWLSLNHENVTKLYGACNEGRLAFICELAEKGTLVSLAKTMGPSRIWRSLWRASLGLQYLHSNGIVHASLSGRKLLVTSSNEVKLSGFGFSELISNINYDVGRGSVRWKSPEYLSGSHPTFASDIFSFGMCILEVLTGTFPWGKKIPDEAVKYEVTTRRRLPPQPREMNDDEWNLVQQMCQFNPESRIGVDTVVHRLYSIYSSYVGVHQAGSHVMPSFAKASGTPKWFLPSYQVVLRDHIADGSFAAVYRGEWFGTDVVIKKALDAENQMQFRREANLWFTLNHDNIIKLYGACSEDRPYFVCERATSGTIVSFLKGKKKLDVWKAIWQAALGLQHLHELGIVHGDLKGNNILVCSEGKVKLADFGLSFVAKTEKAEMGALGAYQWKAPECLLGCRPTFASDIFSFGMCVIEAITGDYPWGTLKDPVVRYQVATEKLLPPRTYNFSDIEWELVRRACCYEPHLRINAGAVANLAHWIYESFWESNE